MHADTYQPESRSAALELRRCVPPPSVRFLEPGNRCADTLRSEVALSRYRQFDRRRIQLRGISERGHDIRVEDCLQLAAPESAIETEEVVQLIRHVYQARARSSPVIAMLGAHPIKLGLSRYVIDLMERGWITHVATNGAGLIHDYELATCGGTSESVAKWIQCGQFGLWEETSRLNDVVGSAASRGEGLGEGLGRYLEEQEAPYRHLSIAAAGWRLGIPVTCHVSIGSDIVHSHANADGGTFGQTSMTDFLIFAAAIQDLEGGVFLNIGSAVTGPEVYLKALSMARNVASQNNAEIRHFATAVFDLVPLPSNYRSGTPDKDHPGYYYRPWKTILVRTVADGGQSYYICADHRQSIPSLWHYLTQTQAPR